MENFGDCWGCCICCVDWIGGVWRDDDGIVCRSVVFWLFEFFLLFKNIILFVNFVFKYEVLFLIDILLLFNVEML